MSGMAYSINFVQPPAETLVLKLPEDNVVEWKEINRIITESQGLVERIPVNQTKENWSELIAIQYFNKYVSSIDNLINALKKETINAYPGNKVTWKILEKNHSDIIYEWILHKPYKNIPAQHEIVRLFLNETGVHRIGFTHKYDEIKPEEKGKWLNLLRESVSILKMDEAQNNIQNLSLAYKKTNLELGNIFKNWNIIDDLSFDNGFSIIIAVAPGQNLEYVTEYVEIMTMSNLNESSVFQISEKQKQLIQSKFGKINFKELKKTKNEIIYSYTFPQDNLIVNGLIRELIVNDGYYFINYKRGLQHELKKEEITQWQKHLESIKIRG